MYVLVHVDNGTAANTYRALGAQAARHREGPRQSHAADLVCILPASSRADGLRSPAKSSRAELGAGRSAARHLAADVVPRLLSAHRWFLAGIDTPLHTQVAAVVAPACGLPCYLRTVFLPGSSRLFRAHNWIP